MSHWTRQFTTRSLLRRIASEADTIAQQSSAELKTTADTLRWHALRGNSVERLIPQAFALVQTATRRAIGFAHHPEQLQGGLTMSRGGIAEMQTGEGKTISALLPAFLWSLAGEGCHIITANDYLARRDAELADTILSSLGTSVGLIQPHMEPFDRKAAYDCDITYGTVKEFGFDFLKDRLRVGPAQALQENHSHETFVQRGHFFVLVDEADSVLIDEARTPLVIAEQQPQDAQTHTLLHWACRLADKLQAQHDYHFDSRTRAATLTTGGNRRLMLERKPGDLRSVPHARIAASIENALTARRAYVRDRDYLLDNGTVQIIDEPTGRILHGRKWQAGLHHAIEVREGMEISDRNAESGRITIQRFLQRYEHICGMTGTAWSVRKELQRTFNTPVQRIPPHRPPRRRQLPTRIFRTTAAKHAAIADTVRHITQTGRPVLIGTPSVGSSETIAAALKNRGIDNLAVLHARQDLTEAEIIAQAGQPGRVTVATNMAGRGTDILVPAAAQQAGGLHVILTAMHPSQRIDRQLIGRTGRQGEAGSFQFLLSLEDEILAILPLPTKRMLGRTATRIGPDELSLRHLKYFRAAQEQFETLHRQQRSDLLKQERQQEQTARKLGLDPYLEFFDGDDIAA